MALSDAALRVLADLGQHALRLAAAPKHLPAAACNAVLRSLLTSPLTKSAWADSVLAGGGGGFRMALGRQRDRQEEMLVAWPEMPPSPGHAFYDRLQAELVTAGFDRFVEGQCAP
jgi:transposase